jgi:hypothetical protein
LNEAGAKKRVSLEAFLYRAPGVSKFSGIRDAYHGSSRHVGSPDLLDVANEKKFQMDSGKVR